MSPVEFTVTAGHIALLERTYMGWNNMAYDGAPGVGLKRPYGNSDVMGDVFEITQPEAHAAMGEEEFDDWYDEDHDDLMVIHREMEYIIQIALNLAGKGELIEAGATYRRPQPYDTRTWEKVLS